MWLPTQTVRNTYAVCNLQESNGYGAAEGDGVGVGEGKGEGKGEGEGEGAAMKALREDINYADPHQWRAQFLIKEPTHSN